VPDLDHAQAVETCRQISDRMFGNRRQVLKALPGMIMPLRFGSRASGNPHQSQNFPRVYAFSPTKPV
jgi:hypothetical protein